MDIVAITLFPELLQSVVSCGIARKAVACGQLTLQSINPRDFATDAQHTVDDRPYGGGPGMVMKAEPLRAALQQARRLLPAAPVVYLTPQGQPYQQSQAEAFAATPALILLAGRYEGIDERVVDADVDLEVSVGDYVLSGGEIAAMAVVDSVSRLLPGVLGHADSAAEDSFSNDGLLDCPHYTRPEVLAGVRVPAVLLSGDHRRIRRWRREQSVQRTWARRKDLLEHALLSTEDRATLALCKLNSNKSGETH